MLRLAVVAETLALALWVGALAGFAFVFAPEAFHRVTDPVVFGPLIAATLRRLDGRGAACGAVALVAIAARATMPAARRAALLRGGLVVVMLGLAAYGDRVVLPRMEATAAGYRALHDDAARRAAFDRDHHASSRLYGGVLVCGLAALVLGALAPQGRREASL